MYFTSASIGRTGAELAEWPLSGSVLRRTADTPGRLATLFCLAREVTA